jgi:predicted transcriptional regulator
MKRSKVTVTTETSDGFFKRVLRNAARLDRGETIAPGITISFEDPLEMLEVLTSERVRLLRKAKIGAAPVADLASALKRDVRAVSRDVDRLEKAGLLRTSFQTNPGHGRRKVVEPVAREFRLTANL